MMSRNIPSCWMTSESSLCNVEKWNDTSKFQTPVTSLFVNKNNQIWVWIFFVRLKGTFWYQYYLDFLFCLFAAAASMACEQSRLSMTQQYFCAGMWEKSRSLVFMEDSWAATWQNQQNECAPSEDSDQPGYPLSLIRVFAVHLMGS